MSSNKSAPGYINPAFSLAERLRLLEAQINATTSPSRQVGAPLIHGLHSIKRDASPRSTAGSVTAREHTPMAPAPLRSPSASETTAVSAKRSRWPRRRIATAVVFAALTTGATTLSLGWAPSMDPASSADPTFAAPASQARLLDIAHSAQRLAQAASRPTAPRKVAAAITKPTFTLGMTVPQSTLGAVKLPLFVANPVGGAILTIDGLPEGAKFTHGMQIADGSWSLPLADLETAFLSLPLTTPNELSLLVRVVGRDSETLTESELRLNIERPRLAIASAQTNGPLPEPIARLIAGKEAPRAHHATPSRTATVSTEPQPQPQPGSRSTARAEPVSSFIKQTAATKDVAAPSRSDTPRHSKRVRPKQSVNQALTVAPSKLGGSADRSAPRAGGETRDAGAVSPAFPEITAVPAWAPFQHHHKP